MIIYISGKMTGLPDCNYPEFNRVAALIRAMGHIVLNPAENPAGLSYEEYMAIDLQYVWRCNVVVLLPGEEWKTSRGVAVEAQAALALGIPVISAHEMGIRR